LGEEANNSQLNKIHLKMSKMESTRTLDLFNQNLHLMEDSEKLELAKQCKIDGVELFKKKELKKAFVEFTTGIKYLVTILDRVEGTDDQNPLLKDKTELLTVLYNNVASCHVLKGNWEHAVDVATSVLENDPLNVKALYRRGMSYVQIQEYEKARTDLEKALELDPGNQAVQGQLVLLKEKVKKFDAEFAVPMRKFFNSN
jgi:FK506-binding protein 4/5